MKEKNPPAFGRRCTIYDFTRRFKIFKSAAAFGRAL